MAALSAVDSNQSAAEAGNRGSSFLGFSWYLSRNDLEENSPSRRDGIDLKKEAYLRKSYCTFLQELGMKLKVPQVTIATAIIFCHRFFLRQSHAKNDRRTIATVCMFLAGKVEETPRPLKDVIIVSYEIIHKKDPTAAQRIKQKEVYEQQKELILLGERVVLVTLGFDFNVHHPYKPLVEAIKKFKVAQNTLAQVAWNFVNDGLRTSLCLQFKPHHIAAGAIFLAAKFLKVKLPSDGEKVWWQEFDITPRQLEEVSNQMLELYEQNQGTPTSAESVPEGNTASTPNHGIPSKAQPSVGESSVKREHNQAARSSSAKCSSQFTSDQLHLQMGKLSGVSSVVQHENSDTSITEPNGTVMNQSEDSGKPAWYHGTGNAVDTISGKASTHGFEQHTEIAARAGNVGDGELKESDTGRNNIPKGYAHVDAAKKIDKDKVRAALEKRRKSQNDVSRVDLTDDDDLIERELESGVELAAENGKIRRENQSNWSKLTSGHEAIHSNHALEYTKDRTTLVAETAEEGELSFDNCDFQSPEPNSRKRKIAVHV